MAAAVLIVYFTLPTALLRARETIMSPIRVMLAESDVNEQEWRVLRVLEEAGPVKRNDDPDDKRKSLLLILAADKAVIQNHSAASYELFSRPQDLLAPTNCKPCLICLKTSVPSNLIRKAPVGTASNPSRCANLRASESMVIPDGFEPSTCRLGGGRSIP